MSPANEIRFIVQRELRKNFRSAKGIVLGVLTLLGGSSIALLWLKIEEIKRKQLGQLSPEQVHEVRLKTLEQGYDTDQARSLADSPEVLLILLILTIWLTPMLVALMGFDSIAPDLQHRSVRYWSLRTRRWSYFVGKWAGLWATVSIVTLAMDALIWIVCIIRGEASAATTFGWGVRFWLTSLPMSAVWCGIATLISSLFRSPILALLLTFASFFVIWVVFIVGIVVPVEPLVYVYPNYYDHFLLHPAPHKLGIGLAACFGMAALYVAGGSTLFARRDV